MRLRSHAECRSTALQARFRPEQGHSEAVRLRGEGPLLRIESRRLCVCVPGGQTEHTMLERLSRSGRSRRSDLLLVQNEMLAPADRLFSPKKAPSAITSTPPPTE